MELIQIANPHFIVHGRLSTDKRTLFGWGKDVSLVGRMHPSLPSYLLAVLSTAFATFVRWILDPVLRGAEAFDVYYVAVAVVAWRFGWKPAAVTLLTSLFAALWFFVPPHHSFSIFTPAQAVPLLTFLAVGGGLLCISEMLHRAVRSAESSARELAHQKEEYQSSFDLSVVGQAQVAPSTGRFLRVNAAFCNLTGYSREELLQLTFAEITHPKDKDRDLLGLKQLTAGDIPSYTSEKRYIRKDGQTVCVKLDAVMLRDEAGAPLRTIGIFEDITARKKAEEDLRKSQSLLASFADISPALFFIKDTQGRHILITRHYQEVFGKPKGDLLGKTDFELFPREDALRYQQRDQEVCRAQMPLQFDEQALLPDGIHHFAVIQFPLKDEEGKTYAIGGVAMDITPRLKVEMALRESEERLLLAQEAANAGVWDWNLDSGKIIWTGVTWMVYGLPRKTEEVSYDMWRSFLHPDDQERACAVLAEVLANGESYTDEFRIVQPGGAVRWLVSRGKVTRNTAGKAVRMLGIAMDITHLKQVEQDLQAAQTQLTRHARELEKQVVERTAHLQETIRSLELLLYNIAHHLRAPNRAMEGFAQLLLDGYAGVLDIRGRDYVERIAAAARRNDALILDLLDYGRLVHTELPCATVSLEEHVREALQLLDSMLQAKHASVDTKLPLPLVRAHPATLNMVLLQLLQNALKFSSPERTPALTISAESEPQSVRLTIEDNGIGIQPQHLGKIFKVFERLHGSEEYPGTGMGLALVEKAVTRMGGQAGVESEFGKGSRFWITLPKPAAD